MQLRVVALTQTYICFVQVNKIGIVFPVKYDALTLLIRFF